MVKWLGWIVGIGVFLAMLYACALPGDLPVGRDDSGTLAGIYTVNGEDSTGAEYSGTLVVQGPDDTDTYELEWIITGSIQRGEGWVEGDRFRATWWSSTTEEVTGTVEYEIGADGVLRGEVVVDGTGLVSTETVYPAP